MENLSINLPAKAEMPKQVAEIETPKKNKKMFDIDFSVIGSARKGFNMVPSQLKSNELKLEYLRASAAKLEDIQKFHGRFMVKAHELESILSDRSSVVSACKEIGTDVFTLATHVVFMGKTAMQKVIKHGVGEKSPIHGQLHLFKDAFMPLDAQNFVTPSWKPSAKSEVSTFRDS